MAFRSDCAEDASIAVELSKEYHKEEENTKKENKLLLLKSTLSIVSSDWETLDPNPDIQALFLEFNERFFFGKLLFCTVDWTKHMEPGELGCAGKCEYLEQCSRAHITLSEQILKRRPRKDTVETLLHEMIHAYLFMTRGIFDGHGSEFVFHMDRINKETGASITVQHGFVEEVDMAMAEIRNSMEGTNVKEKISESTLKHVEIENNNDGDVIEELHKPCITCNALDNNDAEEDKVKQVREVDVSRIRFLLFNGRSTTKHFHPDSALEEVYKIAQTLLPGTSVPSLSVRTPSLSLDTVPRHQTLRELGLGQSVTIMVVPGTEPQDHDTSENSLFSSGSVILGIFLVCLLGFLYQSPSHQDYQTLPVAKDLAGSVVDLSYGVGSSVGGVFWRMYVESDWYDVFGCILVFCVLRSMYVGLPYGRLVWVGRYDHN